MGGNSNQGQAPWAGSNPIEEMEQPIKVSFDENKNWTGSPKGV